MADTKPRGWAVLIGINFYRDNKSLNGCVHDVTSVKAFLDESAPHIDATVFTASQPSDPTSNVPSEEPALLPTYENVTSELERIKEQARAGDTVYIHYSGHGTTGRTPLTNSQDPHLDTEEFALVLYDEAHGMRKLPGSELARLLKAMVDKSLVVILVLDCCFSGGVTRDGSRSRPKVRSIDYDNSIAATYSSLPHRGQGPLRDGRMAPQWLINPEGYATLCACGPYETAEEFEFDDGKFHGALTYFLLRALKALRRSGVEMDTQALYQHICARFHASVPHQNPRRFGNETLSWFGKRLVNGDNAFSTVFFPQEGSQLCLRAGYAHGVQRGDDFALCPLTEARNADPRSDSHIRVTASLVRGLTSDLVSSAPDISLGRVKSGWVATPRTQLRLQNTMIQLSLEDDDIKTWHQRSNSRTFLRFCEDDLGGQPCAFKIRVNSRREYEVTDQSSQPLVCLPTVPCGRDDAIDVAISILEHVAIYKSIEAIENRHPMPPFSESFSIQLQTPEGKCAVNAGVLDVKNKDTLTIKIQNTGKASIYVHLLDLRPSWKIVNMIQDDGTDYIEVRGGSENRKMTIDMIVPDDIVAQGRKYCEDVFKFFVTSEATSIDRLSLKQLPKSADDVGSGLRGEQDTMSTFLLRLTSPMRGARAGVLSENWQALNFVIRTTIDEGSGVM
ncbi:hypothetical protein FOPE_10244 [Fonsecaea pedrosoi]|nr:hypothetical protein FOPE_10244 [Fonsecaea pedrosoi]